MIPVILSGGSGSRLWPLSRELYPKQFLSLLGDRTMLQDTAQRAAPIANGVGPLVVCNEEHRFIVAEQLRQANLPPSGIVLEPEGRNTAPAVAIAAIRALEMEDAPVLLVLPADHLIEDVESFHAAAQVGLTAAQDGALVTFGIVPTAPETGFGYIRRGAEDANGDGPGSGSFPVAEFVEKPDGQTAQQYLDSGGYYWNSGMFMFKATRYLEELERWAPEMLQACRRAYEGARRDLDFVRLDREAFLACPSDSIDYAVMEKTERAVVVPLEAGWSDVGSWSALWQTSRQDENGNVVLGDVLTQDVRNSYLRGESRLVAAIGVDNHVVVETPDAVLVAHKDRVQDVKSIVNHLKSLGRDERRVHRQVHRPWGSYEGICVAERFQVKRIIVKPGHSLSLQMHHHRAEHWIVVRGTACVTRGEEIITLSEDESTYIPLGTKHRLENPGKIPLELIEVQTGSYLGEDDIVRFEDVYGRDEK